MKMHCMRWYVMSNQSTKEAAHEGWQRLRNSYKGRFVVLQAYG